MLFFTLTTCPNFRDHYNTVDNKLVYACEDKLFRIIWQVYSELFWFFAPNFCVSRHSNFALRLKLKAWRDDDACGCCDGELCKGVTAMWRQRGVDDCDSGIIPLISSMLSQVPLSYFSPMTGQKSCINLANTENIRIFAPALRTVAH